MAIGDITQEPQPGPIPNSAAWGALDTQSTFANTASFIEPQPPSANDTPNCFYPVPNLVTLAPNAVYKIPRGAGQLITAGTTNGAVVQMQQGTTGNWITVKSLNASDSWYYDSDYTNLQIANGVSGTTVLTLLPRRKR